MKGAIVFITAVLGLIAVAGLGAGGWMVLKAIQFAGQVRGNEGTGGAIMLVGMALLPILVGTVALVGVVVAFMGEVSHTAQEQQTLVLRDLREYLRVQGLPPAPQTPTSPKARGDIYG